MADKVRAEKLIGGDVELGNFIMEDTPVAGKSDYKASRLLLAEIIGLPDRAGYGHPFAFSQFTGPGDGDYAHFTSTREPGATSQDYGRKYLASNGGCIYIDLNHLELATPEVLSARDYQAVWTAMLRNARQAQERANSEMSAGSRIVVLANNSDRQGHSYGGHQSFLITRQAWDDMIHRRMLPSLFNLIAYQVSSIVFTGQGKVGSENGAAPADYQISQRADFMETLLGEQTTYHRPLVNTRDEALCGLRAGASGQPLPADRYARLHVIFYDTNLAPVATYLKVGVMQLILTMIEDGCVDKDLVLEDPLDTLQQWSRDLDLNVSMPLVSGQRLTAVELQLRFLEQARAFDARHGFASRVPDAQHIMALWEDTLAKLASRSFDKLSGRLDWVMKRSLLEQAVDEHAGGDWQAAQVRYLDQIYASIDPADSLFLSLDQAGLFEPVAAEAEIARFVTSPPEDTRAWLRAMLLRAAGPQRVVAVDWDRIDLKRFPNGTSVRIGLADPLRGMSPDTRLVFSEHADFASLLRRLHEIGAISLTTLPGIQFTPVAPAPAYYPYDFNAYEEHNDE